MEREKVAAAIASFPALLKDAQERDCNHDLLVMLPVFERYREEALAQLSTALRDGPSGVRWMAASALRMLGDAQAALALASALGTVPMQKEVSRHVIRELCRMPASTPTREALLRAMQDRDRDIRSEAVSALGALDPQALLANIDAVFDDADALVHLIAIGFLEKLGDADLVVDLIERCPNARVRLILLLAELRDPRAVDLLLKMIAGVFPVSSYEREEVIKHLAELEDPRTLATLISLLGKAKDRESNEKIRLALLSLQTQVGDEERALIRTAVAEYEKRIKQAWPPSSGATGEPAPVFTLDTYRAFLAEVEDARSSVYWANIARDFGRAGTAARKLSFELPSVYWARLPVFLLARCPICGGRVTEPLDTFSLSGIGWWYNEPNGLGWFGPKPRSDHDSTRLMDPSYTAECDHAQAVHYGVNLNGIIPDDVKAVSDVVIGSERPGVWWPFLEQEGNYAVIHALPVGRLDDDPWQPRYTVYFVTYFGPDKAAFQRSLLPWKWYDPNFLWQYDLTDYELTPWAAAGKLYWLGEAEAGFPLRQGVEGFPYANIIGLEGYWAVDRNKGAKLLPPVKGLAPYMKGYPSLLDLEAKEKAALQARGFRHISRE
ncbi:MAG TPA: hypothetical protein PKH77_16125 [Anaerolineae bacterium]|nr:hypothetical protein [Anaerolineae bacterium]